MIAKKIVYRVRNLSKNGFLKVSFTNGIITLSKTAVTIFSNKIIASIIGPSGLGMVGQLQNFLTIAILISSGGFNQGITKYVAEQKTDRLSLVQFISTGAIATGVFSVFIGVLTLLLSNVLSIQIFDNAEYSSILVIFSVTLIFYNLNNLIIAVINGFQDYHKFFKINIVTFAITVVLSITLVVLLRDYGALLAIVLCPSLVFMFTYFVVRSEYWTKAISSQQFSREKFKLLLKYTTITLLSSILWPVSNIVIRSYVIKHISPDEAGLWEATRKINDYIVNIAIGSFSVYLLPRLAEITKQQNMRIEFINVYKIIIPTVIGGFTILYVFRNIIIELLYSPSFLKVGDYLPLQMMGSFFWMCKLVPMNLMLTKGNTRVYIYFEIFFCILYLLLGMFLVPKYGVQGIQLSFAIYNLIYLLACIPPTIKLINNL